MYGKPPAKVTAYLDFPLICVHEYKRTSNPVTISRAYAQLLGGMWIIQRQNHAKGHACAVYGLMVKGQAWHFAELHSSENGQCLAHLDFDGFSIASDLNVIFKALRHYFLQAQQILEAVSSKL